jgi:hypothetical protein
MHGQRMDRQRIDRLGLDAHDRGRVGDRFAGLLAEGERTP